MKKQLKNLYIITFLSMINNQINTHVISLFLYPYPTVATPQKISHQVEKIKQPGRIGYYSIKSLFNDPIVSGIFATYSGYITISNFNGQILFPNKQTQPLVNLLCTTRLTPEVMLGNTIFDWKLEEGTPATFYTIEFKQDPETENYYWETQQKPLPENSKIPASTLWIIAQPEKIYAPLGITPAIKNENLILPPIYVKKGVLKIANALYILNLKHFFLPVGKEFKREAAHTREIIF